MNLKDLPRVPELPSGYFYRVETAGDSNRLRVQVREDAGPSWWPERRSRAVTSVRVDLSEWRDASAAMEWAAKRCVFRQGYASSGKRAWLVRHEATAFLGDHR